MSQLAAGRALYCAGRDRSQAAHFYCVLPTCGTPYDCSSTTLRPAITQGSVLHHEHT